MGFYIHVQETPNPDAVKFISQYTVKSEGKSNYKSPDEAAHQSLASKLFEIDGVKSVFFFDNYVTITRAEGAEWGPLGEAVMDLLQTELPEHDPNFSDPTDAADEDVEVTPEVAQINEILDRTVRPYLAADGGGIKVEKREENRVYVRYEGACGSCPSSIGGTLMAIQSILQDELDPDIEVIETGGAGEMYGGWW